MNDLVRLIATRGSDECNHAGVAYRVTPWNTVLVHADAVPALLKTGGFCKPADDHLLLRHSTLAECREACWALPKGKFRDTLLALLTNTNMFNYLVDRAKPNIAII